MKRIDFNILILFENNDYLVINKPSGISTLTDRKDNIDLISLAKSSYPEIHACHRIDKDTSGVLVYAKNPEGYKHLSMQFQNREVIKKYHAIVQGQTEFKNYLVDIPLIEKGQGTVRWDTRNGKKSSTVFSTLENFKDYSLVECRPITGRRHQIRVHLKYAHHPILADTTYSGEYLYLSHIKRNYKPTKRAETPLINRMALHASSISFKTLTGEEQNITADYPKDFQVLLKQLRKYN